MTDKILTIRILTPGGTLHEGTADAVFLPGALFPFEVLPGHGAIISALSAGVIRIVDGAQEPCFEVSGGVVRVLDDVITVCAETA